MKLVREFAKQGKNKHGELAPKRAGSFIPIEEVLDTVLRLKDPAFCSIYAFDYDHVIENIRSGNSKGLSKLPVYSDILWLDLDDGTDSLQEYENLCQTNGWGYQVWESGGKGYHLGIAMEPMYNQYVPYSQRMFIDALGLPYDETLYQHGRMFANPGRIHPKTGKRKKLIKSVDGSRVRIPIIVPPPKNITQLKSLSGDEYELAVACMQMQFGIENEPPKGGRHTLLWSIALNFFDAGISKTTTLELLEVMNNSWSSPKSQDELERAVDQAYGEK